MNKCTVVILNHGLPHSSEDKKPHYMHQVRSKADKSQNTSSYSMTLIISSYKTSKHI